MHTVAEKIESLCFMLQCLGIAMSGPTLVFGNSLGVQMPEADLEKKHMALSCHVCHKAVVSGVACPTWLKSGQNHSDTSTKQIFSLLFIGHVHDHF